MSQQILSILTSPYLTLVLIALTLLLFVCLIITNARLGRLRKQMKRFFAASDGGNLEAGLARLLDRMEQWEKQQSDQQFQINRLAQKVAGQCGNLAVLRYNAFDEVGSDLSFSIAILDDEQNGVVITSIYGREESRTYAKPIKQGKSAYNLSEEELAVLKMAGSSHG